MRYLFIFIIIGFHSAVLSQALKPNAFQENYRPQFHFTPARNWTNDPNGLVFFQGDYHLFYQYNPLGNTWGHMSWAHAASKDLVHWKHLPLAIPEKDSIMIFSGSCVVDENNSTGFATKPGQMALVAIYTAHVIPLKTDPENYRQEQHIAYSLDQGRTWIKYRGNPVLDIHKKDFRDPKVFWYAPEKKWVMAVVLPHEHKVQLYDSKNLKKWNHLSDFGPAGDTTDIWECPDLLQVPTEGMPGKMKWVLFNSQQVTVQYFVGEFNGKDFVSDNPASTIFRQDYGPDYYAVITYNHIPAGRPPVSIGWVNNWTYAKDIPTYPWKSMMSLPRELSLKRKDNEWILIQHPAPAIERLRSDLYTWKGDVNNSIKLPVNGQQIELKLEIEMEKQGIAGVKLAVGKSNEFIVGYNASEEVLYIDRSHATDTSFNQKFSAMNRYQVPLKLENGQLELHIFYDRSVIEVFAQHGEAVLTTQLFTHAKNDGIEVFAAKGSIRIKTLKVWKMKSSWD